MEKDAHGRLGSVFCNQSQRTRSSQPKSRRLVKTSPPSSGGLVTFGQVFKQCPPLTSFLPLHRNQECPPNFINGDQEEDNVQHLLITCEHV